MPAQTAKNELHNALYTALAPNNTIVPTLSNLGFIAVYNIRGVPTSTKPQYIVIGDTNELPNNTLGRKGFNLLTSLHLFTRDGGTYNTDAAIDYLNSVLDQQRLTLATLNMVGLMYNTSSGTLDADGLTWHSIVKYDAFIQQ